MTKEKLLELLSNPHKVVTANLQELENLAGQYPFCYIFHALIAKAYHDLQAPGKEAKLHTAAVSSPNRKMLKQFILTQPYITEEPETEPNTVSDFTINPEPEHHQVLPEDNNTETDSTDNITEENNTTETEFESLPVSEPVEDNTENNEMEVDKTEISGNIADLEKEEDQKKLFLELEENLRALKQRREEANNDTMEPSVESDPVKEEEIISELKEKEIAESGFHDERQKEQFELIGKFIEIQPRFTRMQPMADQAENEDLSAPSSVIGDDLVTENLANIMVNQGKFTAAIDIYKKLIWKFPQKKSYFADRIEELNKKI